MSEQIPSQLETSRSQPLISRAAKRMILFLVLAIFALASIVIWMSGRTDLNEELIVAARSGHVEDVRMLLEKGASPNARDLPVDQRSFWERLLDFFTGVRIPVADARTVLSCATDAREPEAVVKLLLEHGADVKADNASKDPAIISASRGGQLTTVRMLLDAGADPNARTDFGFTPLHGAVLADDVELAKLLIERGAEQNRTAHFFGTSLSAARSLAMRDFLTKMQANTAAQQSPASPLAPDSRSAAIRKALEAEYRKRIRLIQKDDLKGYASTLTDDMEYDGGDGIRLDKKAYLPYIELMLDETSPANKFAYKVTDLRVFGSEAVVEVYQSIESHYPQRKLTTLSELASHETWVETAAGWKVKQVVERGLSMFRNGKKVFPR